MSKQIPVYFDSVVVSSPIENISTSNPNLSRLTVRVFTKYGNRNGSYITEKVANQLIESATSGITPVVGFYDPSSQKWASHTGPTLANAYGYVESFLGWVPYMDTDGVVRDYATFSVILFTDYFEEATKVLGQNQSMELDPQSITGAWTEIDGEEYYVFNTAKMLGFCIIGEHEPCFSVSSFFAKNEDQDNDNENYFEKFSLLLNDLKAQVEQLDEKGGTPPMNEFENQEVVEEEIAENTPDSENFEKENEKVEEENTEFTSSVEDSAAQESDEQSTPDGDNSEFEQLQQNFEELQNSMNELQQQFDALKAHAEELEAFQATANTELEDLRAKNAELQTSVDTYEKQIAEFDNEKKVQLVDKYKKIMDDEIVTPIQEKMQDYSYEELESKLAIAFANTKIVENEETVKVPLSEPEETQFSLLMKKYRKN